MSVLYEGCWSCERGEMGETGYMGCDVDGIVGLYRVGAGGGV